MSGTANSRLSGSAPVSAGHRQPRPLAIARWLLAVAGLILFMVLVGGITRLTESGLSITEWKPVTGAIPPLTQADWQAEFALYKQSSQYALMNQGMTLAAFKHIFFWEYAHRLLGRLIGLAYALPMLWFFARGAVPRGYGLRLLALLVLGGAQGAVGWFMVKSGLTARVNVEPAMLAAHLGMALLLLGAVVWTAWDMLVLARRPDAPRVRLTIGGGAVLAILFLQLLLGALVAGLRAGAVSSTWPLMNDHFVPQGIAWWGSFWLTITSDPFLVHFLHRWWAWVALIALVLTAKALRRQGALALSSVLLGVVLFQIMLGIATVVTMVALPFAALHQLVGALLFAVAVAGAHRLAQASR
ncbi:COX15/CtaA family protein [Sphingobium sp. CR28]|uniref:COX15/CtaA family protein n=1 Tax=Sphingobium sp. CR28 TaxID=3400272 RepID=UPI003FEF85BB